MIRVKNRHVSTINGIPPKAIAEVPEGVAARFKWALVPIGDDDPREEREAGGSEAFTAREAKAYIRELDDPDEVREFLGDGRSSVHGAAVRRLRQLRRAGGGEA